MGSYKRVIESWEASRNVKHATISNGFAFLIDNKWVDVVDISSPQKPVEVGVYYYNRVDHIEMSGSKAFITTSDDVLGVIETIRATPVEEPVEQPSQLVLHQNYPNPFNPTTHIVYTLPNANYVTLRVYNVLGQLISTLVNKRQSAGEHTINFDAPDLPSGMYLYRLKTGTHTETQKMMLIK